jgi:hypothetical protein
MWEIWRSLRTGVEIELLPELDWLPNAAKTLLLVLAYWAGEEETKLWSRESDGLRALSLLCLDKLISATFWPNVKDIWRHFDFYL